MRDDVEEVRAAKAQVMERFGETLGVAGVGVTRIEGWLGLAVNVETPDDVVPMQQALATLALGVPTRVRCVGGVRKLRQ
jgi:hypothetical protein